MPASRPSYQWPGTGLLRASTAPAGIDPPADLDLTAPALDRRATAWLIELRQHPPVRAALTVASPDLLAALDALDPDYQGDADERRLRRLITATVSYLLRWQHRATPFGLFAGIGAVRRAPATAVRWGDGHQAVSQVDPAWLAQILTRLHASPDLLERLTVATNTAITVRGNRLVAPGPSPGPSTDAQAELAPVEVSVRATRPVRIALDAARTPIRVGDLAKILTGAFPAATPGQINGILAGLIEQNLLISSLHPPMTSPDALGHVCGILRDVAARDIPDLADLTETLCVLHHGLAAARPPIEPDSAIGTDDMTGAPASGASSGSAAGRVPLVVDTVLDADVGLPEHVGAEAARAAAVLCRLSPYPFGTPAWRDYHGRFLARYGTGLPVPVLELVGDSGLGFPAGYLGSGWGLPPRLFTARDERLLTLVQNAVAAGGELVLADALVEELADDRNATLSWPDRVEIGVQVHAVSAEAIDRGRFTLLVTGTPRPGSSMAGRHAHHLPDDVRAALAATLATTAPGSIAVQLSFPPRRRRNAPLAAAIPLLDHLLPLAEHPAQGGSGTRVVTVDEIAVVAEPDRFHLLHQPSGQRVEVRVAHALEATTHLPPLARLLSEITTARSAFYAAFHFGAAARMPYLPRVRYRRTILALARWLLPATVFPGPTAPHQQWEEAFAAWRHRWDVPARVAIADHDRRLTLDLDQAMHRHLLRTRLNRTPRIELHESITDHGWIGRAHELLLPLRLPPPPAAWTVPEIRTMLDTSLAANGSGATLPGASAVVFARLLAHPDRWNELLTGHMRRLLASFGEAPRWWFLRHHDLRRPGTIPYLGLYLHLPSGEDYGEATAHLAAWATDLARQNLAAQLTLDTFHPQPGQYGHGSALNAAYAVFAADTTAALTQIALAARTGIPTAAVTAASMVDLATALARTLDEGIRHLVDSLPQQHGRLDPALRDHALRLTDPTQAQAGLAELPGGSEVIAAWQQRAAVVRAYRAELQADRDPMTVLPVLLRGHHRRAQAVDGEQTTLRLARACALRHTHQAPQ